MSFFLNNFLGIYLVLFLTQKILLDWYFKTSEFLYSLNRCIQAILFKVLLLNFSFGSGRQDDLDQPFL